ncbi:hypothetical protein EMMF5_000048 [Cystobasidiomycetes sp. EMM_F5]
MKNYLLQWAQILSDFRMPELQAVCEALDVEISWTQADVDLNNPFMRVRIASDEAAHRLGSRCVLLKAVYELWATAPTYDSLFHNLQNCEATRVLLEPYMTGTSFKFVVESYNNSLTSEHKRSVIQNFAFLDFQGPIRMSDPDMKVYVLEDWPDVVHRDGRPTDRHMRRVFIGRWVCDGQRALIDRFDLKKRVYIGNTSMEAGVSLVMANMAKAGPGKIIYDPFVGTGSMLYTAAHFGAYVFGSDIDGRSIRGKRGKSVYDSATQYGVTEQFLDCCVFDITQNPWRTTGFIDAIISDPPYGVRESAKRLGRKVEDKARDGPYQMPDGTFSHQRSDFVPPSRTWEMSEVLVELLKQALLLLRPGGRLVYWLPTITAIYKDSDVPQLQGLRLIANSEQKFGKWSRRLITMEKEREAVTTNGIRVEDPADSRQPGHFDFRTNYFKTHRNPEI